MTTLPLPTLDHVVINARDRMDEAADCYRRLGFQLTPRGHHTLGSINHLAIFGTEYLELIAIEPGQTTGRVDLLDYPAGLNGLVFGTEDSLAMHAALKHAGAPVADPIEFSRPVALAQGSEDARFRVVRLLPGAAPYGRVYFCHHFTRHLVWRDEWRRHANGTVGVARAVIAAADPEATARLYRTMFGAEAVREIPDGHRLVVGLSQFDILAQGAVAWAFGDAAPDAQGRDTYMAALTFRTLSLDRAARAMQAGGIAARRDGPRLVVPASQAFGATLEFIE